MTEARSGALAESYCQFQGHWGPGARLAWDTLAQRPTRGIPSGGCHVMDTDFIERQLGALPGSFARDSDGLYTAFKHRAGICLLDQYLAGNVLTMTARGYAPSAARGATTGLERIELDGLVIDSPEAVVEHLERFVFPQRARRIEQIDAGEDDEDSAVAALIAAEIRRQRQIGLDILKAPYDGGFQSFPHLGYYRYGYASYFMAYALFPEVMERDFSQQADLAERLNRRSARAIVEGGLPRMVRLDHDMADGRGTLVDIRSLDRIWFPHFARSIRPLLEAGVKLIWHCDGNLMAMVPRLLECGLSGFQGFQYEFGMDYPAICRMRTRDGGPLLIIAGVSVTTTLPHGTPADVRAELRHLVEQGPPVGLFLGASSSIVPGTPHANIQALIEGLWHYREHGRGCGRTCP